MRKPFLRVGAFYGLTAVALGAFGSHGLREMLEGQQLRVFETGVDYQFFHALAIVGVSILLYFSKKPFLIYAAWAFSIGVVFFSGSLYLLAIRDLTRFFPAWLGPITPVGGIFLMLGWIFLFLSSFQNGTHYIRRKDQD